MKRRFPAIATVFGFAAWLICLPELKAQPERLSQTGLFGPDGEILTVPAIKNRVPEPLPPAAELSQAHK